MQNKIVDYLQTSAILEGRHADCDITAAKQTLETFYYLTLQEFPGKPAAFSWKAEKI